MPDGIPGHVGLVLGLGSRAGPGLGLEAGRIGAGGGGSVIAGKLADGLGRTAVTIASLIVSGSCVLTVGLLFGRSPALLVLVCLVWGFAVVRLRPVLGLRQRAAPRRVHGNGPDPSDEPWIPADPDDDPPGGIISGGPTSSRLGRSA